MVLDEENMGKRNIQNQIQKQKQFTAGQWLTFAILVFGNFCSGASFSLQAPFFPKEAERKGATPSEYGWIFGIFQLTIFFGSPLMGKLISYVEPKLLVNAGVLLDGLACLMFGFLDYVDVRVIFVSLAFILRILGGLGTATTDTSACAIITAQFPDNMGTVFAFLETSFALGYCIGPTIGGALYDLGSFGLPFYFVGSLLLIDAITIFVFLPKPERSCDSRSGDLLKFWMHPSTLIHASVVCSNSIYFQYIEACLEPHMREFHLSGLHMGLLFAVLAASYAISAPYWGWLCDKEWNTELISAFGYLTIIGSLILIGPLPFLKLKKGLLTCNFALILMGIGGSAQNISTFASSLKDSKARGFPSDINTVALIASMITASQSLGGFLGPSLGGYVLENMGFIAGTYIILLMDILLLFLLLLYVTVGRRRLLSAQPSEERHPIVHKDYNSCIKNEEQYF